MGEIFQIRLLHAAVLSPLAHLTVLEQADSVDALICINLESLLHTEGSCVGTFRDRGKGRLAFAGEKVPLCVGKRNLAFIHGHGESRRLVDGGSAFLGLAHLHLFWLGDDHQRFFLYILSVILHDTDCVGRVKLYFLRMSADWHTEKREGRNE